MPTIFPFEFRRTTLLPILLVAFTVILSGSSAASNPLGDLTGDHSAAQNQSHLTKILNETVGTAISPLLVMCVKLAHRQMNSETVDPLLIVLCLFLLLTLLKDVLPVSVVKKPLDAVEELTSSLPALLGLLLILPELVGHLAPSAAESIQALLNGVGPATAYAADDPNQAVHGVSSLATWLGGALVALAGTVTYIAVWLLSNTLTILCLLVPAPLGPVVKSGRVALVGFLYTLDSYHPGLALIFSLPIIIIAFFLCRWTFNLTVWGGIYSFDLLTLAWRRHEPGPEPMAFVTGDGQKALKIAKRTLGRLSMENGRLIFRYRYLLLFPKTIELPPPEQTAIGRRLTTPVLLQRTEDRLVPLLVFRLSCRTHEELLARHFGGLDVQEVGLSRWLQRAWSWLDRGVSSSNSPVPSG